jgi:ribonuclease Z
VGVAISRCRVLDTSSAAAGEHTLQFPFRRCYSYRILFEEPKRPTDALSSYIRTCLSASYTNREDPRLHGHSNFHLAFLGSGGGNPSTRRVTCGTLLHLGGTSYLFDAGEGMQRQIMFSQFQFYQISKIFITHLHGDHIFGLVGLLLQLSLTGKNMEKQLTVEVYGPPGIYNFIATNIALSVSTLRPKYIHIKVHELFGGSESGHSRGDKGQRSIFSSHYPEISNQCISRKRIDRGSDGTWIIQEFDRDNFANSARRRSLRIVAAELQHLRGIQTFGFVVQEEEPLRTIDAQKAIKLGVKPSRKYQQLKQGLSVETDDGLRQVRPEDVLLGETKKARKVAVLGDTCHVPPEMMQLCQDVDVLVHEATIPCDSTAVSAFAVRVQLVLDEPID